VAPGATLSGLPNLFFQYWYSRPSFSVFFAAPMAGLRSYMTCMSTLISTAVGPPNSLRPFVPM
jgi:hypothetical protein